MLTKTPMTRQVIGPAMLLRNPLTTQSGVMTNRRNRATADMPQI